MKVKYNNKPMHWAWKTSMSYEQVSDQTLHGDHTAQKPSWIQNSSAEITTKSGCNRATSK